MIIHDKSVRINGEVIALFIYFDAKKNKEKQMANIIIKYIIFQSRHH